MKRYNDIAKIEIQARKMRAEFVADIARRAWVRLTHRAPSTARAA